MDILIHLHGYIDAFINYNLENCVGTPIHLTIFQFQNSQHHKVDAFTSNLKK